MTPPRLFISYSWSSQEHELWVVDLATRLMESGIDVILDKWELKEGYDSIAFMEKMVTDPTIVKVAVISDEKYAQKADSRVSGVGTETQIISREVYEKQDQNKFVAVLPERDEEGSPRRISNDDVESAQHTVRIRLTETAQRQATGLVDPVFRSKQHTPLKGLELEVS
jgi:hypothetical protein